jgi:hypothetical protein
LIGIAAVRRVYRLQREEAAAPAFDEAQVLHGDDLGDGEAVVQFGELISAARRPPFRRPSRGGRARRKGGDVGLLIERHEVGGLRDAQHLHRLIGEFAGAIGRRTATRRPRRR